MAEFLEPLLVARPISGGFTWILATRLSDILHQAELRFGQRDAAFTVVGVEFRDGVPQIWYPGNRRHIVVQLGRQCLTDERRAVFQLAHEVVHLLDPMPSHSVSVLEEGLATIYSGQEVHRLLGGAYHPNDPTYVRAAGLVAPLVETDPAGIKKLRQAGIKLSTVRPSDLCAVWPSLREEQAFQLCEAFGPEHNVA